MMVPTPIGLYFLSFTEMTKMSESIRVILGANLPKLQNKRVGATLLTGNLTFCTLELYVISIIHS